MVSELGGYAKNDTRGFAPYRVGDNLCVIVHCQYGQHTVISCGRRLTPTLLLQSNGPVITHCPNTGDMSYPTYGVGSHLRHNADGAIFHYLDDFRCLLFQAFITIVPLDVVHGNADTVQILSHVVCRRPLEIKYPLNSVTALSSTACSNISC